MYEDIYAEYREAPTRRTSKIFTCEKKNVKNEIACSKYIFKMQAVKAGTKQAFIVLISGAMFKINGASG